MDAGFVAAFGSGDSAIAAHFERIGSTEDFSNYYTKSEVDSIKTALQGNITTNATAISTLSGTVSDMDTAYKAADTALDGRLDSLEEEVGAASNPDADSLRGRMAALETTVGDSTSGLVKTVADNYTALSNADSALDGRLDVVEAAIGTYPTTAGTETIATRLDNIEDAIGEGSETSLASRMTTAESDIDALETALGATTDPATGTVRARLNAAESDIDALEAADTAMDTRMDTAESDIDNLEAALGDATNPATGTVRARLNTAESDIDALETELASHDFKYAGSQSEGGAADNVVETAATADADREVLIANADKDAVNYASNVKVNPSTGAVTLNAIKLGAATVTYDSTTASLVVNF